LIDAANADDACKLLESRSDVRIVLTDINLRRSIDGLRLATLIRNRWPPIDLIITSGAATPADDEMPTRAIFLPKPFGTKTLKDALNNFLSYS
jgi:DNA-binding NtrC family response regulator